MDELTKQVVGRRYLGLACSEHAVAWATSEVELGRDTPALVMLAGLSKPLDPWEVDRLFARALDELGWSSPSRSEALWSLARLVASKIVAQPHAAPISLEPHVTDLERICVALDYPAELMCFVELDDFAPRWSGMMTPDTWKEEALACAQALLNTGSSAVE